MAIKVGRQRRRENGHNVVVLRPDAAANAKTPAVRVLHGGNSFNLLHARLDLRTQVGRSHRDYILAVEAHLGAMTAPQRRLADLAARCAILATVAFDVLQETFDEGAIQTFLRAVARESSILLALGVEIRPGTLAEMERERRDYDEKMKALNRKEDDEVRQFSDKQWR